MKIVVADGYALNPGDMDWGPIAELGELKVYDRIAAAETAKLCAGADIILTNKAPLSGEHINALPDLKFISVLATGYNIVDIAAAKARGIPVSNIPGYGTDSVAQHCFALLLELTNHTGLNSSSVAAGEWQTSPDFSYTLKPIMELAGKTMGIVGFGTIGQKVAQVAAALGMKVIFSNRSNKVPPAGMQQVSMDELFAMADVVSLHCPLTADNNQFINAALLRRMKPTSILLNTARGQLINEAELATALNEGVIAGAGLDVLSKEPPADNPLLKAKNCIITPHTAWISTEARQRIMDITVTNIRKFLEGTPQHVVN